MAGSIAHSDPAAVRRVLDALAQSLRAAAADAAPLRNFARRVSAVDPATGVAPSPPARLPVCRLWNEALLGAPAALTEPLAALGPSLSWMQNPKDRKSVV